MPRSFNSEVRSALPAAERLELLLRAVLKNIQSRGSRTQTLLCDALGALETVILTSEEFATASNRLRNALGYIEHAEWAAAGYETRLTLNWFSRRRREIAST